MKILFCTTTQNPPYLNLQQSLLRQAYPSADFVLFNGYGFPNCWYHWFNHCINTEKEYDFIVHVDDDFFLTNKLELDNLLNFMKNSEYDCAGVPDAHFNFRQNTNLVYNSFFMVFKHKSLLKLKGYNYKGLKFDTKYIDNVKHVHNYPLPNGYKHGDFEPYYDFMWALHENNFKLYFLYPYEDNEFITTNPKIDKQSDYIGIHMWYSRIWNSDYVVHGIPNNERYKKVFSHIRNISENTFVCFSDENYKELQKELNKKFINLGYRTLSYSPHDIDSTFYENNKSILDNKRGAGYCLWKPYFILKALDYLEENNYLLYMDCGDWSSIDVGDVLKNNMIDDIILIKNVHTNKKYTKQYFIDYFNLDEQYLNDTMLEAGTIYLRKTEKSINFIKEWLYLCQIEKLIDDNSYGINNKDYYIDNRYDQTILTYLAYKHNIQTIPINFLIDNCDLIYNKKF
mgnify:CR=1 FL=1